MLLPVRERLRVAAPFRQPLLGLEVTTGEGDEIVQQLRHVGSLLAALHGVGDPVQEERHAGMLPVDHRYADRQLGPQVEVKHLSRLPCRQGLQVTGERVLAARLALVHGGVGTAEERLHVVAVLGAHADADAGAHPALASSEKERFTQGGKDHSGHDGRRVRVAHGARREAGKEKGRRVAPPAPPLPVKTYLFLSLTNRPRAMKPIGAVVDWPAALVTVAMIV